MYREPAYRDHGIDAQAISKRLRENPNTRIEVRNIKTGEHFPLVLNSFGELCFLVDKRHKRVLPLNGEDYEVVESKTILSAASTMAPGKAEPENREKGRDAAPASPTDNSMDVYSFIHGFNAFVEAVASGRAYEKPAAPPKQEISEKLEELKTTFLVVVPPDYEVETLAAKYVVAISNSLLDLKNNILPKTNYTVESLVTEGLVKDIPGLMPIIVDALDEAGFNYSYSSTNGAYLRLKVWLEE